MYYLEAGYGKHDRLRNAVVAALLLHAVLILGLAFEAGKETYQAPQIEVTLATRSNEQAPDDARLMAQANQVGGQASWSLREWYCDLWYPLPSRLQPVQNSAASACRFHVGSELDAWRISASDAPSRGQSRRASSPRCMFR